MKDEDTDWRAAAADLLSLAGEVRGELKSALAQVTQRLRPKQVVVKAKDAVRNSAVSQETVHLSSFNPVRDGERLLRMFDQSNRGAIGDPAEDGSVVVGGTCPDGVWIIHIHKHI